MKRALLMVAALALVTDARADLFVGVANTSTVLDVTTGGTPFIPPLSGGLSNAQGLAFGPNGNLFVVSYGLGQVQEYNGTTGASVGTFVSTGNLSYPKDLVFGPNGDLFVTYGIFAGQGGVQQFNGTTGAFMGTFVGGLSDPIGLVFTPGGNLLVSNNSTNQILEYDNTGNYIGVFADSTSGLNQPNGLLFGPNGNLFVANQGDADVLEYYANGTFDTTFVSPSSGNLGGPYGLAFGPNGNLYVSGQGSNNVLEYNGTTGTFIADVLPGSTPTLDTPTFFALTPTPASSAVPEPASLTLLVVGAVGALGYAWRRRKQAA